MDEIAVMQKTTYTDVFKKVVQFFFESLPSRASGTEIRSGASSASATKEQPFRV